MSTRRHRPEDSIQRTVCQHLQARGCPGLVWWHTPNGGKRSRIEAAIMKGLGVRAGVSDLIAVHEGRAFALELKADGGRPTEVQLQFIEDFQAAGGYAVVAEGLDQALRVLETWNLLRGVAS
jgi:VRR-NUC domain